MGEAILNAAGRGKRSSAIGILLFLGGTFIFGYDILPLLPYFVPLVAYLFGADVYSQQVSSNAQFSNSK